MKAAFFITALALQLRAANVALEWDPSPSPGIAGYRVHYGTNSGGYSAFNSFSRTNRIGTISNLAPGRWFFAATAVASNGLESVKSNEVNVNVLPLSPQITRITGPTDALLLQSAPSAAGPWKTVAVITSSNQPVLLTAASRQFFRTIATNLPPLPR